jgi:hypothetical protein
VAMVLDRFRSKRVGAHRSNIASTAINRYEFRYREFTGTGGRRGVGGGHPPIVAETSWYRRGTESRLALAT